MKNDKVRIGVIGVGAIGPSHVYSIQRTEGCALAAICDLRADAAARIAGENGVPYFTSVKDMVQGDTVDAVTISTPSGFHLDTALEAIEAGKHVLSEKPLEITTERIDRIIAAADRKRVKLGGVFQCRFSPVVRRLKKLVDGGLLGEIYAGSVYMKRFRTQAYYDSAGWRGTWKVDGGGCLMNQGIHYVDLFLWFMGEAQEVIAITETVGRKVEVETLALSLVKFASGARGVVEGTTLAYPEIPSYLEIFGSRGTLSFNSEKVLRMDLIDPTPAEASERDALFALRAELEAKKAGEKKTVAAGTAVPSLDMGHGPVIADFVEAIRTDRAPFVNGPEARRAVDLITAIYESGRNGSRPVQIVRKGDG